MAAGGRGGAVSEVKTFGRRQARAADPLSLSPEAEALRDALLGAPRDETDLAAFQEFQRQRRARVVSVWILRLLLCAPGLLCAVVGAPTSVSLLVETVGLILGVWIRQERRRQLKEIAIWQPNR
jgi:Flp pilus assembly protein TadB